MRDDDELRRQFEAAVSGAELDDLRALTAAHDGVHIDPLLGVREQGLNEDLVWLIRRVQGQPHAGRLLGIAQGLQSTWVLPPVERYDTAMAPVTWLLRRAEGDGIALTKAGYLTPKDVQALTATTPQWGEPEKREGDIAPLLIVRENLQRMGLLRKRHGKLLITKAGRWGLADSGRLWQHLSSRLIPVAPRFEREASLITLLCACAPVLDEKLVESVMHSLGWDGLRWLTISARVPALSFLSSIEPPADGEPRGLGPVSQALVREALFGHA